MGISSLSNVRTQHPSGGQRTSQYEPPADPRLSHDAVAAPISPSTRDPASMKWASATA